MPSEVIFSYQDRQFHFEPDTLRFMAMDESLGNQNILDQNADEDSRESLYPYPTGINFITLNIAHDCNMACPYCFAKQGHYGGPRKLMSEEVAFRSIDWLLERSGDQQDCYLWFLGGEPLMNLPLMRAGIAYGIEAAQRAEKRIHFSVSTNGTIWNEEIDDLLRANRISISISMCGSKDAHNVHRIFRSGRGTFDVIAANVPRFLDIHPDALANATLTADNLDIDDYVSVFREFGFRAIRFSIVSTSIPGVAVCHGETLRHIREQYDRVAQRYLADIERGDIWYLADFYKYFENLRERRPRLNRCGAGTNYVNIDVDGNVHLCHRFTADKTQRLGDVSSGEFHVPESVGRKHQLHLERPSVPSRGQTARDVTNMQQSFGAIHHQLDGSPLIGPGRMDGRVNLCAECDIRFLCGGSCFHDGALLFGDLHGGPDAFKCEIDRHLARIAIWLIDSVSRSCPDALDQISEIYEQTLQELHKRTLQIRTVTDGEPELDTLVERDKALQRV